jgi:predicted enzyme related to lactoylglutathione lyase
VLDFAEDPRDPNLPGHEECMIFSPDGRQRLLFIEVPEDKTVKNRMHLDLAPTDRTRDEEVERLLAHGATVHQDLRTPDGRGWVTLLDPEGNEFCVLRSDAERPDPYAHLVR